MNVTAADGVKLNVLIDGPDDGPAVLLVNSLGCDLGMWDQQMPALTGTFRVVRYDARGHGASDIPPGPYTIEQLGADGLAVLDAAGAERASVCGVSLGGQVALWLAASPGRRIDRAVYANTAARIGTADQWDTRAETVHTDGLAAVAPAVIQRFFSERFRREAPDDVARIRDTLLRTSPHGYEAACRGLRETDLRPLLDAISTPSLVIAGRHDIATPPHDTLELADRIPSCRSVILDAGHLSNIEQPDRFNTALLTFLQEGDPTGVRR